MKTIVALSLIAGAVAFAAPDMPRPDQHVPCPQGRSSQDMRPGSQGRPAMNRSGVPGRPDMNKPCPGGRPVHPVAQPKDHGPQPMPVPPHGPASRR